MARPLMMLLVQVLFVSACKTNDPAADARLDVSPDIGRMTPSALCDVYLNCLAAAEPQSFPATLQIYQADGPCWKTPAASSGCEKACVEALAVLAARHPSVAACTSAKPDMRVTRDGARDASTLPDWPVFPPVTPTKAVDILFMVDNSNSMEAKQDNLQKNFPRLIEALRSPKLGALPGQTCTATDVTGCKIPNLRIGVISADLGAGQFSYQTCEYPGGDRGVLKTGPGKLSAPGCATPKDPWISYSDDVTNVQNARSIDPVDQVKEAFSCVAYLGTGGCGFEHQLESTRRALDGCQNAGQCKTNPGFLRATAGLVVVLLTDEDDCSARRTELFDPTQQGLNDPLGPLNSFRCTEFGLVCAEKLRQPGEKHNCVPGLDYLYAIADYVGFFKALRPPQRLLVAAIAGPVAPVAVGLDGSNPTLKASCNSVAGTGVPGIRLKAVVDGLGTSGLFNQGVAGGKNVEVNICSPDFSPALQLIGDRIAQWY